MPTNNNLNIRTFLGEESLNYSQARNADGITIIEWKNIIFAIWTETNNLNEVVIRTKKWNGTNWVTADNNTTLNYNVALLSATPKFIVFLDTLYAVWTEQTISGGSNVRIKKWNGTAPDNGTAWISADNNVGLNYDTSSSSYYPQPIIYKNELYVIWQEENSNAIDCIRAKKWNGITWISVDNNAELNYNNLKYARSPKAIVYNDKLYVCWVEQNGTNIFQLRMKNFDGNVWVTADSNAPISNNSSNNNYNPSMCIYDDKLCITWQEQNGSKPGEIKVISFNNSSWAYLEFDRLNYDASNYVSSPFLITNSTTLYAIWNETDKSSVIKIRIKKYNGSNWISVDDNIGLNYNITRNVTSNPYAISYNDILYLSWSESVNTGGSLRNVYVSNLSYDELTGIDLDQHNINLYLGDTKKLQPIFTPMNAPDKRLIWSSSNTEVATVDSNGQIKTVALGTTKITVTTVDKGFSAICDISVEAHVTGITLNKSATTIYAGESESLIATVTPDNALDKSVEWSTSNPLIATVNSSGLVTGITSGMVTITAKTVDKGFTTTCGVNVLTHANGITLNKTSNWNYENKSIVFYGNVTPTSASNKNISIISDNTDSVTVNSVTYDPVDYPNYSFKVTLKTLKPGISNIILTTIDSNYSATYTVTVYPNLNNINITQGDIKIGIGQAIQLYVDNNGEPINTSKYVFSWFSTKSSIVNVDNFGIITGMSSGVANVQVSSGPYIDEMGGSNTFTNKITVTVYNSVTGISLNKNTTTMYVGDSETLIATVSPETATDKSVTWISSNSEVVTVNSNGLITARGNGTATITVKTNDIEYIATCEVSVLVHVDNISFQKSSSTIYVGDSEQLIVNITPTNASNAKISYISDNSSIASVNSEGLVTGLEKGNCVITATSEDGNHSTKCSFEVMKRVSEVNLNKSTTTITKGNSEMLTATVLPADANNKDVTWQSSDPLVATVNNTGTVNAIKSGNAIITVTTKDGKLTASCYVKVNTAPTILISKDKVTIANNQSINLYELIDYKFQLQYIDPENDDGFYKIVMNGLTVIDYTDITNNAIYDITIPSGSLSNKNTIQIYAKDSEGLELIAISFIIKLVIIDDISIQGIYDDFVLIGEKSIGGLSNTLEAPGKLSFKDIINYLQS